MKKIAINGIEFINPKIFVDWDFKESDVIKHLKIEKNESKIYSFEATLIPVKLKVSNVIKFYDKGFKLDVVVLETTSYRDSNAIYIDEDNTMKMKEYVEKKLGEPRFISRVISTLNKPFYSYKWKFEKIKITYKYKDSVGGFFESLTFDVDY